MRQLLQCRVQCTVVGGGQDCCLEGERQENCSKVRQRMLKLLQCRVVGGGHNCCQGNAKRIVQKYANEHLHK
jgi:hypothetical protein